MTRQELIDDEEEVLFMDGFDDCILGVCDMFGRPTSLARGWGRTRLSSFGG